MKKKWWILGGVALAAAGSLCIFGVRVRIAPRLILTKALESALEQVDDRFENSPVHLLTAALDSQGRQEAQLKLETEEKHLGAVVYDMQLHTQLSPNRILGTGSVITGGKVLDLSLYLDEKFAAVSSDSLISGNFYGITYDTFSQDIRERQLLAALIGEKTITGWEASVASLQEKMATDLSRPDVKPEDIRTALYAALALKPEVGREEVVISDGIQKAYTITFQATGAEIYTVSEARRDQLKPALLQWIDRMNSDPESRVRITFSLHKGKLVQILGEIHQSSENTEIQLYFGENPEENAMSLEVKIRAGEALERYDLQIMTESDSENYRETLSLMRSENGRQTRSSVEYQWDLSSGDMNLEVRNGGRKVEQRLNLTGEGESLTVRSQNIRPLLNFLLGEEKESPAICTLTVLPGGDVAVPEYRNLDQWSGEDLLVLLEGLGSLIGITLP